MMHTMSNLLFSSQITALNDGLPGNGLGLMMLLYLDLLYYSAAIRDQGDT